jgi:exonuclease SbcD
VPPAAAVELLDDVLSRLVLGLRVPVVAIAGNHDSPERLSFGSRLLREAGLHLVGGLLDLLFRFGGPSESR